MDILNSFSDKFKQSEDKVQSYLKEEVGSNISGMTYQEHLFYVIHLLHKKEELYKEAIQQMMEKVR